MSFQTRQLHDRANTTRHAIQCCMWVHAARSVELASIAPPEFGLPTMSVVTFAGTVTIEQKSRIFAFQSLWDPSMRFEVHSACPLHMAAALLRGKTHRAQHTALST